MNDIEVLENIITEYNTQVEDYKFFTVPVRLDETDIEALENAIKSLKERQSDKERIKDLEEENEKIKSSLTNTAVAYANSIPKSLIKEKKKEIREKAEMCNSIELLIYAEIDKVLEEILKEAGKNDKN